MIGLMRFPAKKWVQAEDLGSDIYQLYDLDGRLMGSASKWNVSIIPDDQVPDHVWAAMAKHQLTKGSS